MNLKLVLRLLGFLCMVFTVTTVVPLLVALAVDHEHILVFLGTTVIAAAVTKLLLHYGTKKTTHRLRIREAMAVVGCGWIMVCLLGALPYLLSGMGLVASLFESVSGFTTTGVTTVRSFDEFGASLLVWRCLTNWCGGIGVIMPFIVIMPQINSGASYLFNAELPNTVAEHSWPRIKKSAIVVAGIYAGLTLGQMVLLLLGGLSFMEAASLALATMSTGGFFLSQGLKGFGSLYVDVICLIFMLIASMNFAFYYKLWIGDFKAVKEYGEHKYYLGLLAFAGAAISINLYLAGDMNVADSIRHGLFQAVSAGSTTGIASTDYSNWPAFSRYVLLLLMFVGGCSGSTASGIKISRLVILLKASWSELLRTLHPRIVYTIRLGRTVVDPVAIGSITRFFFLYVLVYMVLTIAISLTGTSIMESIGIITACLNNVGPAFGIVGPTVDYSQFSTYGRLVTICAMLLGRLEIFTLLVILRPDFWRNKQNW